MKNVLLKTVLVLCFATSVFAQDPFPGTALEFDGVEDYVQADTVVIPSSGNFTVSVWAKTVPSPTGLFEILLFERR